MRKSGSSVLSFASSFQFVIIGVTAVMLAGCSDSVDRFSENYTNPSDKDPVYTASINKPKFQSYRSPRTAALDSDTITTSPIAHAAIAKPPAVDYAASYAKTYRQAPNASSAKVADAADMPAPTYKRPQFAYNAPADTAPAYKTPKNDESVLPADSEKSPTVKPYRKKRGPKITVAEGMSFYEIAKANKLTVKQLAEANDLSAPYTIAPGTQLVIPGRKKPVLPKVAAAKIAIEAPSETAQAETAADVGATHVVTKGDTLFSLGRKYKISAFAIADANGLSHDKSLALGRKIKIPTKTAGAQATAAGKTDGKTDLADKQTKTPKVDSQDVADAAQSDAAVSTPKAAATPSDAQLAMRWPVRGRVISAYGSKPNGLKNEGINIMAPEGTNIQAADAGVVAYAGNELKGYGNLVLIRHAGGYVTAYAHASNLLVKKGDTVKRGDVIAKVGQTGAVQSPQLHFEVRKGATALDPATFLNAATASK